MQQKYRSDIDGLRAVAVLAVVAYHAFPARVGGGFVGVDIFFVISGFLISGIILEGLRDGTFSFSNFYARRVRRIFPALIVVLAACYAIGWMILLSDEFAQLSRHIVAGAGFASNVVLWSEAGYFDNASETKPLLHLWSLGVEEQFYLIWPLMLWAAWRAKISPLVVIVAVGVASFLINIATVSTAPIAAFFLPQNRFWELLAGGALAWVDANRSAWRLLLNERGCLAFFGRVIRPAMSYVGCALLLLSIAVIKPTGFPGFWAICPVLGALMIIAAGSEAWLNRWVLGNPVSAAIGLISYPLYLWHWPLLSFARIYEGDIPSWQVRIAAVVLAFLLATLTYFAIERAFRRVSHGRLKVASLVTGMVAIGGLGIAAAATGGVQSRDIAKRGAAISEAKRDWRYRATTFRDGRIEDLNRLQGQSSSSVLFIGSSIMGQYYPRAKYLYDQPEKPRLSTIYASRNHCTPVPDFDAVSGPENVDCRQYYRAALDLALSDHSIVKVVFGGRWMTLAPGGNLDARSAQFISDLKVLASAGKSVFIIANAPIDRRTDPDAIAVGIRKQPGSGLADAWLSRREIEDVAHLQDLWLVAGKAGASVINPLDSLCEADRCPVVRDGKPLYNNYTHIRADYAASSATFIDSLVAAPNVAAR